MSKLEVDAVEPQSGTSLTLGASGDTITIPSGAIISNQGTATGFGPTGAVSWDVANIKTTGFTAVNGLGYFCNTTSSAFTVTLPASPSAGNVVAISDYAATFATNNITVDPNGNKIAGSTLNKLLNTNGIAVTCVYVDSIEGWIITDSGLQSNFIPVPYSVDFLVVAGGGAGGGHNGGGGGGAGGFRTSTQTVTGGTLITITVGDGGAGVSNATGNNGSDSSISGSGLTTITSGGGGGGGRGQGPNAENGVAGGSGGGAGGETGSNPFPSGGTGNSPNTSPSQGNNGGGNTTSPNFGGGGGGGAGAVGATGTTTQSGAGGNGTASSITGSSVTYAGGGGCGKSGSGAPAGAGGSGGGGTGATTGTGTAGTANLGGGGGGGAGNPATGGAGGKGVVILSMPDANYTGTTTGSPTVATGVSGKTVLTFNGSGSYTG